MPVDGHTGVCVEEHRVDASCTNRLRRLQVEDSVDGEETVENVVAVAVRQEIDVEARD